jgi:hypothetical protein
MGLHQIKKQLHSKIKNSEETACRMGENLCQLSIQQGINTQNA